MMIKQGVKYRLIFCCHFRIGTNDGSLQIAKVVSKQLLTAIITPRIQKIRENAWGSSGTIFLSVIHLCCMTILTRAEALSCNKFFFFHVELNYKRWEEDETFQFFGLVSASRIGNNCIHDFKIQKETPKMMQVATATQSLKITKKCLT